MYLFAYTSAIIFTRSLLQVAFLPVCFKNSSLVNRVSSRANAILSCVSRWPQSQTSSYLGSLAYASQESPVCYMKHTAKSNADTLNATRNCQEPCAPCAQDCSWSCPLRGCCQMPCAVPYSSFHVPQDAGISVHHLNVVRYVSQKYQRSDGGLHSTSYV